MIATPSIHLKASFVLTIFPVHNMVLFSGVPSQLLVGKTEFHRMVEEASFRDCRIAVFTQIDTEEENPSPSALHPVGVVATIHSVYKLPDDHMQVLARTTDRIRLGKVVSDQPYSLAEYDLVDEKTTSDQRELALGQNISQQFQKLANQSLSLDRELNVAIVNLEKQPGPLADIVSSHYDITVADKHALLAEPAVQKCLNQLKVFLNQELSILEMGLQIRHQA